MSAERRLGWPPIADGTTDAQWPENGMRIANGTGLEFQPAILSDVRGGVFVIWVRYWRVGTNTDLIATRITASGSVPPGWPDSGLVVCGAPGRQDLPLPRSRSSGSAEGPQERLRAADHGRGGGAGPLSCAGCDGILSMAPNPGAGRFRLDVENPESGSSALLRIQDVAGRLLRTSQVTDLPPLNERERPRPP